MLGTLPAGYTGTLQMNASGTEVQLVLTSSPFVAKTWTGGDLAANNNTNWSDGLNWSGERSAGCHDPGLFHTHRFRWRLCALSSGRRIQAAVLPARINNIVNTNFTLPALTYANTNGTFQNTAISNGVSLNCPLGEFDRRQPGHGFRKHDGSSDDFRRRHFSVNNRTPSFMSGWADDSHQFHRAGNSRLVWPGVVQRELGEFSGGRGRQQQRPGERPSNSGNAVSGTDESAHRKLGRFRSK